MDHDLVADLPLGDALADLPDDARGVRAADVVVLLGVVAEHRHRLAERRPHVVEVHARRHHAHDHLEGAGLGDLDLLDLEGVLRLALALLADHPGGHRLGQLAGLDVELADVTSHLPVPRRLPPWYRVLNGPLMLSAAAVSQVVRATGATAAATPCRGAGAAARRAASRARSRRPTAATAAASRSEADSALTKVSFSRGRPRAGSWGRAGPGARLFPEPRLSMNQACCWGSAGGRRGGSPAGCR